MLRTWFGSQSSRIQSQVAMPWESLSRWWLLCFCRWSYHPFSDFGTKARHFSRSSLRSGTVGRALEGSSVDKVSTCFKQKLVALGELGFFCTQLQRKILCQNQTRYLKHRFLSRHISSLLQSHQGGSWGGHRARTLGLERLELCRVVTFLYSFLISFFGVIAELMM